MSKPVLRELEGPVTSTGSVRSLSEAEEPGLGTLQQAQGDRSVVKEFKSHYTLGTLQRLSRLIWRER